MTTNGPGGSAVKRNRRGLAAALTVLVAAAIGLVVVPLVYAKVINKAPAAVTFADADRLASEAGVTVAPASGDTDVSGTWKVVAPSTVGYRVKESLNGQSSVAVGRTPAVTGTVTIDGTRIAAAALSVDLTTMKSNQASRDKQFRFRIMDTASHPTATFRLDRPIALGSVPPDGSQVSAAATGTLTLRGVTRQVELPLVARRSGASIQVIGRAKVVFADFGIPSPSISRFVTTQDHGLLEFLVTLSRSSSEPVVRSSAR